MKLSKGILEAEASARETDEYWAEALKLEFALALDKVRRTSGLSGTELAKRLKTSPAYISKVLGGESNLTIESMVKLARAVEGRVRIEIVGEEQRPEIIDFNALFADRMKEIAEKRKIIQEEIARGSGYTKHRIAL
jgi:transcriptional regulator with XRE-family HTH domain